MAELEVPDFIFHLQFQAKYSGQTIQRISAPVVPRTGTASIALIKQIPTITPLQLMFYMFIVYDHRIALRLDFKRENSCNNVLNCNYDGFKTPGIPIYGYANSLTVCYS